MRALLGGVSPHESCLRARTAGGKYEGGSENGRCEVRMVLLEMDGVRVRGGIIEEEEGGGRGAAGEGEEGDGDEETTIGGAMGTDMVVMSEAIAVLFCCFSFPFPECTLFGVASRKGENRSALEEDDVSRGSREMAIQNGMRMTRRWFVGLGGGGFAKCA